MSLENGLYAQVVIMRQRESDDKKEKKTNNITSKGNQQDQDVGLIMVMSG